MILDVTENSGFLEQCSMCAFSAVLLLRQKMYLTGFFANRFGCVLLGSSAQYWPYGSELARSEVSRCPPGGFGHSHRHVLGRCTGVA
jgi:hypothetical protein